MIGWVLLKQNHSDNNDDKEEEEDDDDDEEEVEEEKGRWKLVIESGYAITVGVDDDGGWRQRRRKSINVGIVAVDDAVVVKAAALQRTHPGGGPQHRDCQTDRCCYADDQ